MPPSQAWLWLLPLAVMHVSRRWLTSRPFVRSLYASCALSLFFFGKSNIVRGVAYQARLHPFTQVFLILAATLRNTSSRRKVCRTDVWAQPMT
jgi:hypothetical protein